MQSRCFVAMRQTRHNPTQLEYKLISLIIIEVVY